MNNQQTDTLADSSRKIDWTEQLPASVLAGQTTRYALSELNSQPPFSQFNLALHVADNPATVQQQRIELLKILEPYGAQRLVWLEQTHSTQVYNADGAAGFLPVNADAVITRQPGVACMIMTADCLPVILTDAKGQEVACIHAGWRGLLNGVIENTIDAMLVQPVHAWLGAAIGPASFEVGHDVYTAFIKHHVNNATGFKALGHDKYLGDIYQLSRLRLEAAGIQSIAGGQQNTFGNPERYYSYRRQAQTGRMASFVMIRPNIPILNE